MSERGWSFTTGGDLPTSGDRLSDTARCVVTLGDRLATWRQLIEGLVGSVSCRYALTEYLRALPHREVFWETPGLTESVLDDAAEFVTVAAPGLARAEDRTAFGHLSESDDLAATFLNLGGDAVLVSPTDLGVRTVEYAYLLSFLRTASADQIHALWHAVGQAMVARIGDRPVWVSTSGAGVSWLHVRLDDRPKYYTHARYRADPRP